MTSSLRCVARAGAAMLAALPLLAGCVESPTERGRESFAWTADLTAVGEGVPVVVGDRVIVATADGLVAFDARTGEPSWQADERVAILERLVHADGCVFAPGVGVVRAYDAATGAVLWEHALGDAASPDFAEAAVAEGVLFVGTRDRQVLALDAATGAVRWDARLDDAQWIGGEVRGVSVSGDTVYAALNRLLTANRFNLTVVLVGLDRATGRELWRYQDTDTRTAAPGAPLVHGNLLISGAAAEGTVFAVDRFTGREAWRRAVYGYVWGAPVLHDGALYVVTQAARAYALDPATGQTRWERALGAGAKHAGVCGGRLVVPDYHVDLLSLSTGRHAARLLEASDAEFATGGVAVAEGRAFVAGYTKLYAIDCG